MEAATLYLAVLGLLLAERVVELAINRRNARWLSRHGAVWHRPDGFGPILLAQVLLFGLTTTEVLLAPWARVGWWTWPLLGVLLLAQLLRYWCITTLGRRWNVRVVTLPDAPRVTRGPYRWLPHPNYLAVLAECAALPLAFGAWASLLVVVPVKLVALRRRIRFEDRALGRTSRAG